MKNNEMKFIKLLKNYLGNASVKSLNYVWPKEWDLLMNRKSRIKYTDGISTSSSKDEKGNGDTPFPLNQEGVVPTGSSFNTTNTIIDDKISKKSKNKVSGSQRYIDLSKILVDMKSKLSLNVQEVKVPEWKTNRLHHSRERVNIQTSNLLLGIVLADKMATRLLRLEELLHHIENYPETIVHATKRNAVMILLSVRRKCMNDSACLEIIRQLLAVFGYVDPPSSRGLRILSIDGGGMRGISVIRMLEKLEFLCGKKIYELFDFMCGVSTGAIIACCLMPPHCMSLQEIYQLYRNMSVKVFKQSTFWGTSKLMWSHAYYDTAIWEDLLKNYVGESLLLESTKHPNCPKMAIISTIVNHSKVTPYIFRNYGNPYKRCSEYHGGFKHSVFEAVRASAAAPTVFEEFRTGNILHQDGGLIVNNPAGIALHEARTLWPSERISCIVSCGTGRYDPLPMTDQLRHLKEGSSSWKTILDKILESATDTESVHTLMSDILPEGVYFRLNPHLSGFITMDEINDQRIAILEEDTSMYCRRNEDKFSEIANILTAKRTVLQRSYDFIMEQTKMFRPS